MAVHRFWLATCVGMLADAGPATAQLVTAPNPHGVAATLLPEGPAEPFFTPLGSNGRACATCHRPESGMSLSLRDVRVVMARPGVDIQNHGVFGCLDVRRRFRLR